MSKHWLEGAVIAAQARIDKLPEAYRISLQRRTAELREKHRLSDRKEPNLDTPEGQARDCGGW